MKYIWMIACALLAAALVVLLVPRGTSPTHGHADERLDVVVRVVDGETDRPLSGALVVVARDRDMLHPDEFEWEQEEGWGHRRVAAKRTTDDPVTTLVTSAYVTRWWAGGELSRTKVSLPEILRVHHPGSGPTIVSIDPETPVTEGDEPNTWRLDLGTVRVP